MAMAAFEAESEAFAAAPKTTEADLNALLEEIDREIALDPELADDLLDMLDEEEEENAARPPVAETPEPLLKRPRAAAEDETPVSFDDAPSLEHALSCVNKDRTARPAKRKPAKYETTSQHVEEVAQSTPKGRKAFLVKDKMHICTMLN
jgi:hypothetical protein